MAGGGYYSKHSRPQSLAAAPAIPLLTLAASEVPLSDVIGVGDFGCAGGRNELWPMATVVGELRTRTTAPITVLHSDLPGNDWPTLFGTVFESADSYLAGQPDVFAAATGRTAFERVGPPRSLTIGWSAITLHWLSDMPVVIPDQVYSGLTPAAEAAPLRDRSRADWDSFLAHRAVELVPGGQLVLVVGASFGPGLSGAEGLFEMITDLVTRYRNEGRLSDPEADRLFYPTWNRTPEEFLEPLSERFAHTFRVHEHEMHVIDDSDAYPQFRDRDDAKGFARAYVPFVRAVTEPSFFRWLSPDRSSGDRAALVDDFYRDLQGVIETDPVMATCHWHTYAIRLERL